MGFGFRGASPPWPYVGLGRGGLPRCGYFLSGAGVPWPSAYGWSPYVSRGGAVPPYGGYAPGTPFAPQMTREQELDFLKSEAQAVKGQLEQIEARVRELEAQAEN